MRSREKFLGLGCAAASAAFLAVAWFAIAPWSAAAGLLAFLAWLPAYRWRSGFLPPLALLISIAVAASGLLAGAGIVWTAPGVIFALAAWDLAQRDRGSQPPDSLLEKKHNTALSVSLLLGLLAVAVSQLLRFQISFLWLALVVILALFSLDRLRRMLGEE